MLHVRNPPSVLQVFMYRAEVARALAAYAAGDLSRDDLAACVAPIYTDDALFPDEGTEDEPWRSGDDEASLLLWLVHVADTSVAPEEVSRRTVSRALACYQAAGAEETLALMYLIFDQDRLCDILGKVEQGVISRTGFLNVLSNALYDPSIKAWFAETTAEGLQYMRGLLAEEEYGELVRVLRV
jgi:hypothetical protein